jgi:hypothetical protein
MAYEVGWEPDQIVRTALKHGDPNGFLNHKTDIDERYSLFTQWWLTTPVIDKWPAEALAIQDDHSIGAAAVGPVAGWAAQTGDKNSAAMAIVSGTAGSPRWLGALCLLLNQPKVIRYSDTYAAPEVLGAKPRTPQSGGSTELTLFLPKEQIVQRTLRNIERKARKPVGEHDVGAHWVTHRKRAADQSCQHVWPADSMRRQLCTLCGTLRWRKQESKRGKGPVLMQRRRKLDYSGQPLPKP